jgi:uncharacterized SAM-binding protein YcdF (DUF218 family)
MLFIVSKIVGFLTQPSTLIALAMIVGLARAYRGTSVFGGARAARGVRMAGLAVLAMLIGGLTPLSTWLLVPLEERFPRLELTPHSTDYAGIIVLGGGEDGRASVLRRQLHINEAGDRITEGARLAVLLPTAKLIFTGGAAAILNDTPPGANAVASFWRSIGIPSERIVIEARSRNTYENAVFSRALLAPASGEKWLLVTSAAHMPRSVGVFRRAGFDVTAYPVDYRTNYPADAIDTFGSIPAGMKRFDESVREWIGLFAYWLLGRTSALLPAP